MIDAEGFSDLRFIGQGGLGAVYRAYQAEFDRYVAIKVLNASSDDPDLVASFNRECTSAGRIAWHPNVATVFSRGTSQSRPYLVMEYYPAGSLMREIMNRGAMQPAEVTAYGLRLASALTAAHDAGILHRDVKPQNVLLSSLGEPALADFGLAQLAWATQSSMSGGFTPAFAAPETFDQTPASVQADLYSLAATMHCLASGEVPFGRPGQTISAVIGDVLAGRPLPFPGGAEFDPLRELVCGAMNVDPGARPESVSAFAAQLSEIQAYEGYDETARRQPAVASSDLDDEGIALEDAIPLAGASTNGSGRGKGTADSRTGANADEDADGSTRGSATRQAGWILIAAAAATVALIAAMTWGGEDQPDREIEAETPTEEVNLDPCDQADVTSQLGLLLDFAERGNDEGSEHEDRAVLPGDCDVEPPVVRASTRLERVPDAMAVLNTTGITQLELRPPGFAPAAVAYAASNPNADQPCWAAVIDYAIISDNALGIWTSADYVVAASLFTFTDEDDALGAFVANSLARGAVGAECDGFGEDRVAQLPDTATISFADFDAEVPGTFVNTRVWQGDLPNGYESIPDAKLFRAVAHRGSDVLMLDSAALDPTTKASDMNDFMAFAIDRILDES